MYTYDLNNTSYSLPPDISFAKSVTTLKLRRLHIDDLMVQSLTCGCPLLEYLCLHDCFGMKYLCVSKLPKLKNLEIFFSHELQSVQIIALRLQRLILRQYYDHPCLKVVDVNAPNLITLDFLCGLIPIFLINVPCPCDFAINVWDADTLWFLKLNTFLGAPERIRNLKINVLGKDSLIDLDEIRKSSPSVPYQVENLSLYIEPRNKTALLDGFLSICHPNNLLVSTWFDADKKIFQWLYEGLMNKDTKCCDSSLVKCWRHCLEDVKIESLFTNEKESIAICVDKVMKIWPVLPPGTLKIHIDWCFPALVDSL